MAFERLEHNIEVAAISVAWTWILARFLKVCLRFVVINCVELTILYLLSHVYASATWDNEVDKLVALVVPHNRDLGLRDLQALTDDGWINGLSGTLVNGSAVTLHNAKVHCQYDETVTDKYGDTRVDNHGVASRYILQDFPARSATRFQAEFENFAAPARVQLKRCVVLMDGYDLGQALRTE